MMENVNVKSISTHVPNELENRNLTVAQFKTRFPRLYRKIINSYCDVFDHAAALCLFLRGQRQPHCEVCQTPVTVIKKHRDNSIKFRCRKHAKASIVSSQEIQDANVRGYSLSGVGDTNFTTSIIQVSCPAHGQFSCQVSYFLKGHQCQQCYHQNRKPFISGEKWQARCEKIHNFKYSYKQSVYTGTRNAVEIQCPVHGIFTQNAGLHMRGHGCSLCVADQNRIKYTLTVDEFIKKSSVVHQNKYDYSRCDYQGARKKIDIVCPIHGVFSQVAYYHLAGNGCQLCGQEQSSFKSAAEYEIIEFLESLGVSNIVHSWRGLGTEIDIYLPDHNMAIEYDGIYWHSSGSPETDESQSKKHLNKTVTCEQHNIQLFHILDLEWNQPIKQRIWKSVLAHKLGLSKTRAYARQTVVRHIGSPEAAEFFKANHLQGYARSMTNLALKQGDETIAVGSFAKSRFTKEKCWELVRFATLCDTAVIGGFSKILAAFLQDYPGKIISYANRRWSRGNLYQTTGFTLDHVTKPCYYYTDCKTLWHRTVFQKHRLKDRLPQYDPALTEVQNMYNHHYRRIWDCGNLVYIREPV
jgi:hypothetical protein